MDIGAAIFFTEYSMAPAELAPALEERGFESLWVSGHSHIPVTRRFSLPGGMELSKQYYDVMDPFVTLSVAAAVTRHLKLATGVCLVIQRDTIQTAKLAASLDRVSNGRFLFGARAALGQSRRVHAAIEADGGGGRARPRFVAGDVGRCARGPRPVAPLP